MDSSSTITFIGFVFLAIMAIMTWSLPRAQALIPALITTCYMPLGQVFMIGGLHFPIFRLLLLVGFCRVVARGEIQCLKMTLPDKLFLWWCLATLILGTLAAPSFDRLVNRGGAVYDALGAYFLFRCWIRNLDDVINAVRFLAWMIVPLAASMVIEKFTARNVFSMFGGVPAITVEREGTLRCQGAFMHPILAGTYGATMFPLFFGLWFQRGKSKRAALVGAASSAVITLAAGSSGAMLTMVASFIGFALWRYRYHMRRLRWGVVCVVIALSFVMKAPVWYLIARMSDIVGGTGWYRSYIIDQAIAHFNEWWLVGSTYTAHWAPAGQVLAVDPNNMDIINNYVSEGLAGGVVKLGLFLAIIVQGFKSIGRWMRARSVSNSDRLFVWSIGVVLMAHCVSFLSVSYYDQIVVMWYWLLATLSMLAANKVWLRNKLRLVGDVRPISGEVSGSGREPASTMVN
ncbi:MAG: hypothetical protein QOH39_2174 [Verrucomicrobiota bacterium]|jgi:hypothetical protein